MHDKNKKGLKVFELDADVNLVFLIMLSTARLRSIKILFVSPTMIAQKKTYKGTLQLSCFIVLFFLLRLIVLIMLL